MGRIVRLICLDLIVLYVIGRLPFPLLVIPMVGCAVVYTINEVKEIQNEKKNNRKRNKKKKVTTKKAKS